MQATQVLSYLIFQMNAWEFLISPSRRDLLRLQSGPKSELEVQENRQSEFFFPSPSPAKPSSEISLEKFTRP